MSVFTYDRENEEDRGDSSCSIKHDADVVTRQLDIIWRCGNQNWRQQETNGRSQLRMDTHPEKHTVINAQLFIVRSRSVSILHTGLKTETNRDMQETVRVVGEDENLNIRAVIVEICSEENNKSAQMFGLSV